METALDKFIEQIKEYDFSKVTDDENWIIKIPAWVLTEKIEQAKQMEKKMLCDLVEQLKDYTNESKSILGHDEREPIEFVEIFLKENK